MATTLHADSAVAAVVATDGATSTRRPELLRLISLRGVLALMVFLIHANEQAPVPGVYAISHQAFVFVDFFFVLSGFVLVWADGRRSAVLPFLRKRLARVWPLHLLTLVVALVGAAVSSTPATGAAIFLGVLLLQAWSPSANVHYGLNGSSWSLSDEAFFYALFPLLRGRIERTGFVISLCTVAVAATAVLDLMLTGAGAREYLYVIPLSHLAEFVGGMALAEAALRGTLPHIPFAAGVGSALVSYAAISVLGSEYRSAISALMLPSLVLLIIGGAQADIARCKGLLQTAPLVLLGRISFAFYLVHQLVLKETHAVHLLPSDTIVSGYAYLVGTLSVSLVVAWLLNVMVETPVYRRLGRTR